MFVEIEINSVKYKIPCKDSQKENLLKIAQKFSNRVSNVSSKIKDQDLAIVMAALLLEEELIQIKQKGENIRKLDKIEEDVYDDASNNLKKANAKIKEIIALIDEY